MIEETGRVIAVEDAAVWVETVQKSTCGSCSARKGCGHSLLSKLTDARRSVRAINYFDLSVGDHVVLGVPERTVVMGSMVVYLLPLMMMLIASVTVDAVVGSEGVTILSGLLGLGLGFLLVRLHSMKTKNKVEYQPSVLRPSSDDAFGVCKIELPEPITPQLNK